MAFAVAGSPILPAKWNSGFNFGGGAVTNIHHYKSARVKLGSSLASIRKILCRISIMQATNLPLRITFKSNLILLNTETGSGGGGSLGSPPSHGGGHGDEPFGKHHPVSFGTALLLSKRRYSRPFGSRRGREPWPQSIDAFLRSIRISHILLAVNVAIFAIQALYSPGLLMAGAKVNSAIAAGQYYRLVSPMFIHGSISHLLVNSFSLNSTGPSVESWFGKKRFISLYLASGVTGNLLSYFCSPTPAVGASGAIFGLVGATVVILGRHREILGPRARRGLRSLAYIVLLNFGMGMTPGSRIDNFGHLGGFLGGIAFAYLAGPRLMVRRGVSGKSVLRDEPILSVAFAEFLGRWRNLTKAIRGR